MKANWIPPKGITQLTYYVSKKEFERLTILQAKEIGYNIVVKIHCGKQSDKNYSKWEPGHYTIANFSYKGMHIYMALYHIQPIYKRDFGLGYKLAAFIIKDLPK